MWQKAAKRVEPGATVPNPRYQPIDTALELAEKRLGVRELALRLKVDEDAITAWRYGQSSMPSQTFLRLVDLLTDLQPEWNEWNP